MLDELIKFFKKPYEETKDKAPEGFCPNCWGEQEYDNKFRTLYEDAQVNVNNHSENYAFIQEFMVTHLNGIHLLRDEDKLVCTNCKKQYIKNPD